MFKTYDPALSLESMEPQVDERQEFQRRSLSLHSVNEGTHMSGQGPAAPVKLKIRDTHTHTYKKSNCIKTFDPRCPSP